MKLNNELKETHAVSNDLEAKALSASTTATELHAWDESRTPEELLIALVGATCDNSGDARLLLQTPRGQMIEAWKADAGDVKAYRDLYENDYDGDFTFTPSERQVTILKGRIAGGFIPIGISAPGSEYVPYGMFAVAFGLSRETAAIVLRAYDEGFRRAQDLHGESMDFVIDAVKELFGDAGCTAFLNAYYKGKKQE